MDLPVSPPVAPMLAKLARGLPDGDNYVYEPKWDGFRCIVFRDGDEIELGSRNERPLTRYFPELLGPLRAALPERCVVDGEVVIAGPGGLDFDTLQLRLHPAESRVNRLAVETPASFVGFDLLAVGDADLRDERFSVRRSALEEALAGAVPPVYLTPATTDLAVARDWFDRFEGAGLDGVVAKRVDLPYRENERLMLKVKHERTADCVVAGFRWHKVGGIVGSLLLGLYDEGGTLHHVGVTASFTMARRAELVDELAPYRMTPEDGVAAGHPWAHWAEADAHAGKRLPGAVSRWNAKKDLSFELLRTELVCEVSFDHLQGDRFRHAATFKRWRPDREPASCTYAQMETIVPAELSQLFGVAGDDDPPEGDLMQVATVVEGLKLPEGLRWHGGRLWFSDIHDHRVSNVDGDGRTTTVAEFDDMPSGLGWLPDDSLLVVLMRSCTLVRVAGGRVAPHADLTGFVGDHLNDMVVDSGGTAYVGARTWRGFGEDAIDARHEAVLDCIVKVAPDGTTTLVADDMIGPNGSVITADGRTIMIAETRAFRITMFDIDDEGGLSNRRVFAETAPLHADGIALDAEGALWCGLGSCFGRVVRGGDIVERIEVPEGRLAAACSFGGDDRKTLFLATCQTSNESLQRIHRLEGTLEDERRSDAVGSIEMVRVPVPGAGIP